MIKKMKPYTNMIKKTLDYIMKPILIQEKQRILEFGIITNNKNGRHIQKQTQKNQMTGIKITTRIHNHMNSEDILTVEKIIYSYSKLVQTNRNLI